MINITDASAALKTLYLGVLTEQLNTKINPLLAKLEQTSNDVYGKEVKKLVTNGINGGIGSGTETGSLPIATGNTYLELTLPLKNFFGKIEISDKAIRASQNNSGAFVNLLNTEMDSLIKSSKFNFGRMVFGDGTGKLATIVADATNTDNSQFKVDDVSKFVIGMVIDIETNGNVPASARAKTITAIDYTNKTVRINVVPSSALAAGSIIFNQGSKDKELTGLDAIFGNSASLYGLTRATYSFLQPYKNTSTGALSLECIQDAIDKVEQCAGSTINYITCSYDVRKKYVALCAAKNSNIDVMNLDGGYKALSYAGIPVVADRFCPSGSMYMLNTDDFKLYQLCDWRWLEGESGSVLKQATNTASYSATLVKYADMLCEKPHGQALLSGITVA
ncbi:MAG: phage major capsid protein [Clostridia bacterium]